MNLSREVTNDNFPLSSTVDKTVDRSHRLSSSVLASLGVIEESDQLVCGPVFRTALVIDIVVYGLCRLAPSAIQKLSSRAKPNMRIGALLKELKSSYPVSGALQVSYDLSGSGNTIAQVPRSLDGSLSLRATMQTRFA